jgi:hypothetical protein
VVVDSESESWSWILKQSCDRGIRIKVDAVDSEIESWSWQCLDHKLWFSSSPTMVLIPCLLPRLFFLPTELLDLLHITRNFPNSIPIRQMRWNR